MGGASEVTTAAGTLAAFLRSVRQRLRWAWGMATAQRWLPPVVGVAFVLVAIGHRWPLVWPEPAALAVVAVALAGLAVATIGLRVPPIVAARAADRGLDTRDAFAAALQLPADAPVFGARVAARAEDLAREASAREAVPLRPSWRAWAAVAVLGLAAMGLAVAPNAQDDEVARRAADRERVAAEAARLHEQAEQVRRRPDATAADQELADRLAELARRLEQTDSPAEAAELLRQAESELRQMSDSELQARSSAADGLDRTLASRPLPGSSGGSAAEQLAQAAAGLEGLPPAEQAELARRLVALAETQAAGNPELAQAMRDAAGALRQGDRAAAQAGLERAADAQRAAQGSVRAEASRREAAEALGQARQRVSGRGSGSQSQRQGQGQGQGQPQGQAQGQGQRQGEGQGQGQGQGQGKGQSGQGQGQGPGGQASGRGGSDAGKGGSGPDLSVFDPKRATPGDVLQAEGNPTGADPGDVVGRVAGGEQNAGRVALRDHLSQYADEATRAMDRAAVPPAQRALVESYFERLANPQPSPPR